MHNSGRVRVASAGLGFSLAETLVVLALLAVLLSLAVPGVAALRLRHELQAVAEEAWGSLMLARSQALVHQQRVVLCPAAPSGICNAQGQWHPGWLVFVDSNHNGQHDAQERILQSRGALPPGVRLHGNSTVDQGVGYGADGRSEALNGGFQSGTLLVCRTETSEGWKIVINELGRPRMEKAQAPDCA